MMKLRRAVVSVAVACALVLGAVIPVAAQADHLKCYKVRDPQAKKTYTADLTGLVAEPGCVIKVPAKLACVPATKTNVSPAPPGGGPTGSPNAFLCYVVKCRKSALPQIGMQDQFGARTVKPSKASLLCAPASATTTTTTTQVICPTTTTITPCSGTATCAGFCPGTQSCPATQAGTCGCVGPPVPCGNVGNVFLCQFGDCSAGMQCVITSTGGCPSGCGCQ